MGACTASDKCPVLNSGLAYARLILASIPAYLYSVLLNCMVIISHHKYSLVWYGYISLSYKLLYGRKVYFNN